MKIRDRAAGKNSRGKRRARTVGASGRRRTESGAEAKGAKCAGKWKHQRETRASSINVDCRRRARAQLTRGRFKCIGKQESRAGEEKTGGTPGRCENSKETPARHESILDQKLLSRKDAFLPLFPANLRALVNILHDVLLSLFFRARAPAHSSPIISLTGKFVLFL